MVSLIWKILFLSLVFSCCVDAGGKKRTSRKELDFVRLIRKLKDLPGVEKLTPKGFKLTEKWNPKILNSKQIRKVWRKYKGEMSYYISGQSDKGLKIVPLLSIYHHNKLLPILELSINMKSRKLTVRYQGKISFQRKDVELSAPVLKYFSVLLHINRTAVVLRHGCEAEHVIQLSQPLMKIPSTAKVSISDPRRSPKFTGLLFDAKLFAYITKKPRTCTQYQAMQQDDTITFKDKASARYRYGDEQDIQDVVNNLEIENMYLKEALKSLDQCVCYPQCIVDGVVYDDGDTWQQNFCTICICQKGQPSCSPRLDMANCTAPCTDSPCKNEGSCVDIGMDGYHCECVPPFDGPTCEVRQNPCVWPLEMGCCDSNTTVLRYFYDRFSEDCLPFNYSGCGGNVNNYETLEQCRSVAMTGACCFRRFKTDVDALIDGEQGEESKCEILSIGDCRSLHGDKRLGYQLEVTAFSPGQLCEEVNCLMPSDKCMYDGQTYSPGDKIPQGCQDCMCEADGQWTCSCKVVSERKEIRDMSREELVKFYSAVQQLRLSGPGNDWEKLRDVYMTHSMQANGGHFYLPWHRVFLRRLEQKLQNIDCFITLPYFDFTTDPGRLADAIVWQPSYFGGNGEDDSCVPDHPFGQPGSWRPCIMRKFDLAVPIPSLADLSIALSSESFLDMSMFLETYLSYVHRYIGGDMLTTGAPYDPIFYSIHAYVDMLYWQWQQKGNNKNMFPGAYGNIPMVPFNIPARSVLDLEAQVCVTYALPSKGNPCNVTMTPGPDNNRQPDRGDIPAVTVDLNIPGYEAGFDRRGYSQDGYGKDGFNRDNYDREGYNRCGYNRYGFDREGYNKYGYDVEGFDRNGEQDLTGRYNRDGYNDFCLNRRGLTRDGYDKHGFTVGGIDANECSYYFKGPFATTQTLKIWDILSLQGQGFLTTFPRLCTPLDPVPISWAEQFWITQIKDVSSLVPNSTPNSDRTLSAMDSRFCFDTQSFLTPCTCETTVASCATNPCLLASCPSWPEASCHINFCTECRDVWFYDDRIVDCHGERDFCEPNPCQNGGTCVASIWPTEPQLVTCTCPPGWDGHLCQYPALDVCSLPINTGSLCGQETRWYYNSQSRACEEFVYMGCGGNANNFATLEACQARCSIGACCHRQPRFRNRNIGYGVQGYDRYGFNIKGMNKRGEDRTINNAFFNGSDLYNSKGYDWQGFDRFGYNKAGFDRFGYDRNGFDGEGFNPLGYSEIGEYDGNIDYNEEGYDNEGYNRAGMNCQGHNRRGLNSRGVTVAYIYSCRSATLDQCQNVEQSQGQQVIKFVPGQRCEATTCEKPCGCSHGNMTYGFGEKFRRGCQTCTCMPSGSVICDCISVRQRKEVRDMTREEMEKFQAAIKHLAKETGHPSRWFSLAKMYADHRPQAVGGDHFLPWLRYFLQYVEQEFQDIDCGLTIPYFDWTVDVGDLRKSIVWAANMFGGNGETLEGCVRIHPFKDYHPPFWSPCLRRQFNTKVYLSDAVNLELLMREPRYEKFRLQLEVMSNQFQAWVGGNMQTELAPYDPLFLSHLAFVDRIWSEWQKRQDNGYFNYPQKLRYIPMVPFDVTPDDVISSRSQMCVDYLPLSEGALCNTSVPLYGYDSEGYDRHGYDREGYDRDGFNKRAMDRDGNSDMRGIFSTTGLDRHGYKRNGYDMMDFDRYGFYYDTYNLDGIDSAGYDRDGYDRYGFDRSGMTPYGFLGNGTWTRGERLDLFDRFGYNRYGYSSNGLDRNGYDVYGFDSVGFDKNMCNNFYLGPAYVIIKHWADLELENLGDLSIQIISRICPEVTPLPPWVYSFSWFRRGNQVAQIEAIQNRRQTEYTPQTSSVLDNDLWLPVPPDQRFCFVTNYYNKCPFGQLPVSCPDMCGDRQCPGIVDAVCRTNNCGRCQQEWYNGVTGKVIECSGCVDENGKERPEGSTWAPSVCRVCTCQQGLQNCADTICTEPTCTHPIQVPGQCCKSCDGGCDYFGSIYSNGEVFEESQCNTCQCNYGSVECRRKPCQLTPGCRSSMLLPGDCCPTCMDCGSHTNGSRWRERDSPCIEHTCLNGVSSQRRIQCEEANCQHAYTPAGECCPVCVACFYQGRIIQDGELFSPNLCTSCLCKHGNVECLDEQCPRPQCSMPITAPGECCPTICNSPCVYDEKRYQHGEVFSATYDPCLNCSCDNSIVRCVPMRCETQNLPCQNPVRHGSGCCDLRCPGCVDDGKRYENRDVWVSSSDPCRVNQCREGRIITRPRQTCNRTCTHGTIRRNECCSSCTECLYDGETYSNGQSFMMPGDSLQRCTCTAGNVNCKLIGPCPPIRCSVTETPPGAVCPICKGCTYNGQVYRHGDTVSASRCTILRCREGQVISDRVQCPAPPCRNPVEVDGQCCPICKECSFEGRNYREGSTFPHPSTPCETCHCQRGEVRCRKTSVDTCPPVSCRYPETRPGDCCPSCGGCNYLNRHFQNGQKFVPPGGDACRVCVCEAGTVNCTRMECSPVSCPNPVRPAGRCCPVCPINCNVLGTRYREGQSFGDTMDPCTRCTCWGGRITCQSHACPSTGCTNPARRPGQCCPSCSQCEYNNRVIRNGQVYIDPALPCQECRCTDGTITNTSVSCPPVTCDRPVTLPGRCCPVCEDDIPAPTSDVTCEAGGVTYREGATMPHPTDKCQECSCRRGRVDDCRQKLCPQTRCNSPVFTQEECCPQCTDCNFEGLIHKSGSTFTHPVKRDQTCTCTGGNVMCECNQCQPLTCRDPAPANSTACCPTCNNCLYGNQVRINGTRFPCGESCTTCMCVNGNIQSTPKACSPVDCQHPVTDGCCQNCDQCSYQGRTYSDGQSFSDPRNDCNLCMCDRGTVTCQAKSCPAPTCSYPSNGLCCPECGNCMYPNSAGRLIRNGHRVPSDQDVCTEHLCRNGEIANLTKRCVGVSCQNPVTRNCCPECTDCLYKGLERRNGEYFKNPEDGCSTCQCVDGNVRCSRKQCNPVDCNCPAVKGCCPVCGDCFYRNKFYLDGQNFTDPNETCVKCECQQGNVRCARVSCPLLLCPENVQFYGRNRCCKQCPTPDRLVDCSYEGRRYTPGQSFTCGCDTCTCRRDGTLERRRTDCLPAPCTHPRTSGVCCPSCEYCELRQSTDRAQTLLLTNGERRDDPRDSCTTIICENGNIARLSRSCDVQCTHAVPPSLGKCCPDCTDCFYRDSTGAEQVIRHTEMYSDPGYPCREFICQFGNLNQQQKTCDFVTCDNPTRDRCGCDICDSCLYNGVSYTDGEIFNHLFDPCQECECKVGKYNGLCVIFVGCEHKGERYQDGQQWKMPANPCVTCSCSAGLITCMEMQCFNTCDNPVNVPGQCCPVCPSCRYNGLTYNDGESFSPNGDPCDVCTCESGGLKCHHESCPQIANCPVEQQVPPAPGQCCPTCSGFGTNCTRETVGVRVQPRASQDPCVVCECTASFHWMCTTQRCNPVACPPSVQRVQSGQCCPQCPACYDTREDRYYEEGTTWADNSDPCMVCRCQGGEISCVAVDCPRVFCLDDQVPLRAPGTCCPVCQNIDRAECLYQGNTYQTGDVWTIDECTTCSCLGGTVSCTTEQCDYQSCGFDATLSRIPGQCCPVCQTSPATCLVYGDPHYQTFDGTTISFMGDCRYIMAADCENDDFIVEVQHDRRSAPLAVSWAQNFTVKLSGYKIDLLQNGVVLVNGQVVQSDHRQGPVFSLEVKDGTVFLNTQIGVKLVWNGDSQAELSVPGSYKRKTCGLCGNFNGYPQDDMRTRSKQITNSPSTFGNSWKADDQTSDNCVNAIDIDPCKEVGYRGKRIAETKCAILNGPAFSRCHRTVSPQTFYAACRHDMCVCLDNDTCLCEVLSSYARECAKRGISLAWRSPGLCEFDCDVSKGFVFDECGPVCARTCENFDQPSADISSKCYKPCVASCQCPANKVLHNGRCIDSTACPDISRAFSGSTNVRIP
ncbi:uncharacterized protein [Argopecten irradians]|uniref:uncharacterized protein n=1 Tax=Argopecten irradians TaxID=31199 RepID=UPI0037197C38